MHNRNQVPSRSPSANVDEDPRPDNVVSFDFVSLTPVGTGFESCWVHEAVEAVSKISFRVLYFANGPCTLGAWPDEKSCQTNNGR